MVENPIIIDSLWGYKRCTEYDGYFAESEEEKIVPCAVCGVHELEEDMFDSERWEDMYLCGIRACNEKHYEGWIASMSLQKFYAKKEKHSFGDERFSENL